MKQAYLTLALVAGLGAGFQDEKAPGLIAEFYDIGEELEDFPTVDSERKPTLRRLDKQVDYESTSDAFAGTTLTDHFYARWTGFLKVPKDCKYTFFTESDDGSRLWIDDKQVVDNGGLHAMEEKSGEIDLKAGDVVIKIDVFENEGQAGCKVSWEAEGLPKEVIPEKAFLHKKDKDLDK